MAKVLVMLEVPAISETFEVKVPDNLPVGELTYLLAKSVEDITEGRYRQSNTELLCSRERDALLNEAKTAGAYKLQHGEHLILM